MISDQSSLNLLNSILYIIINNIISNNIIKIIIDILIICDNYFNIDSKRWLKYYHNVSLINSTLSLLKDSELNVTIVDPMHIVSSYPRFNYVYDQSSINSLLLQSKICVIFNKHAAMIPYVGNALLRDNCLLMYHSILGEWNLINKYTGQFFSNTTTLLQNITFILSNRHKFKPKKWYIKKHNPKQKKQLL